MEKIYNYKKSESGRVFYFKSIGPNGVIPKAVIFKEVDPGQYNLALISKLKGAWQDKELTGNDDMHKTFRTIHQIFNEFIAAFPYALVYIEGNTVDKDGVEVSKNIVYQRAIAGLLTELRLSGFNVGGYGANGWEMFEKGKSYDAFFVTKG